MSDVTTIVLEALPIDWRARAEQLTTELAQVRAALGAQRDATNGIVSRADKAEQKGAELAAALKEAGASSNWECADDPAHDVLWIGQTPAPWEGKTGAALLAYRAQVERETLTTIGSLLGLKLCSCWEDIQQRFAPKGETNAERD